MVSLLVGTLVTVVAALVPARRATRVLPVEALRESDAGRRLSKRRALVGSPCSACGAAGMLAGAVRRRAACRSSGSVWSAALVGVMVALPLSSARWRR